MRPAAVRSDQWSPEEIAVAKAQCNLKLKGLDAVVIPVEPFKQGGCGAPAAVQLVSIGKSPQVSLSPPPVLTCDMVAALGQWLKEGVQVAARNHLGAPVIRIDVMSAYSCRGAYGRAHNRLSEHARANALDIRSFIAANAAESALLADWGPTAREIRHQVAMAKAAAEREAAAKSVASAKPVTPPAGAVALATSPTAEPEKTTSVATGASSLGTLIEGVPGLRLPGPRQGEANSGYGLAVPSRLGGPKPTATVVGAPTAHARSLFLREIHASACRIFGTALGPEADAFHRNHFHVDMAARSLRNICE